MNNYLYFSKQKRRHSFEEQESGGERKEEKRLKIGYRQLLKDASGSCLTFKLKQLHRKSFDEPSFPPMPLSKCLSPRIHFSPELVAIQKMHQHKDLPNKDQIII